MNIYQPVNYTTVGTSTWSSATRNLTSFVGPMIITESINQTLAASGSITFFPAAANAFYQATIGVKAGAAGTAVLALFDGTNTFQAISIAAAGSAVLNFNTITQNNKIKLSNNDAANAAQYAISVGEFA